ncbi:hypothetical protein ACFYSC_26950 [Streptosporangium sp. NPDC004379]|uniref:hypothetical protein n=1 Tax=Streptosporangium sp. NPDC004379 TaxID=3366189 RepID=UPI0036A96E73
MSRAPRQPDEGAPREAAPDHRGAPEGTPYGAGATGGGDSGDGGPPTQPSPAARPAGTPSVHPATRHAAAAQAGRGPGTPGAPEAPGRTVTRRAGVVAAAAVAGMLATTLTAAIQWRTADRLRQEESERAAVAGRAREFAVALQTYDYADLRVCRDRVRASSSERFERAYDEAFGRLKEAIISMRARSAASVRDVYVSGVAPDRARAITVVDSTVTSTAGTRRLLGTYLRLDLVRTGGNWKVDDTTVMGTADELVTDPQGRTVAPSPGPSGNAWGDDSADDSGEDE